MVAILLRFVMMYGSVDYDSDSVRNAYHHSSWYNVEFGIDCFLWSYDGGYNAGCVEITDSDHAWSVVLVIVMTRIDNDDGFVSYDDKNVSCFQVYRSTKRNIPMLFIRGDGVILVSPPMRTAG